jgi:calcineurin-like phosphoesterase family protein
MKIFLTSDTFFGRKLTAVQRGFTSVEDMEDAYIENWNSKVSKGDIVYHLGNFSWDPISAESAIIHLQGTIYFIGGSYDKHMSDVSLVKLKKHFLLPSISYIPKDLIVLSHWPLLEWPEKENESIHIHGGDVKTDLSNGYRFNANINNWSGSPIDLEFLKEIKDSTKED